MAGDWKNIDIAAAFRTEPPVMDFVLPGFLAGAVGGLFAVGGAGKSFFALEAAMDVVTGDADPLGLNLTEHGDVLILSVGDPEIVLRHRLHDLGAMLSPSERAEIASGLTIMTRTGVGWDLMTGKDFGEVAEFGEGKRLIVLDSLSRFHRLDENSNRDMFAVRGQMEALALATGAAVLFLHWVGESAALTGRGCWGASLANMSAKEAGKLGELGADEVVGEGMSGYYVRLSLPDRNDGEEVEDRWFRRGTGGVLLPVDLVTVKSKRESTRLLGRGAPASPRMAVGTAVISGGSTSNGLQQKTGSTTAAEGLLRLFQPTQRPTRVVEKEIETLWGKVTITGRLGQRHLDLLQHIRACALRVGRLDDGGISILCDPFEIRKRLGGKGIYSHEGMWTLLNEMVGVLVEVKTPEPWSWERIVNFVVEAKVTERNRLTGKERVSMRVDLGSFATALFDEDLQLYYDPAVISALQHGISQAIARLVLTHKDEPNGGWKIDTLIRQVAGEIDARGMVKARAFIKAEARGLEACGIAVDTEAMRIHLRR